MATDQFIHDRRLKNFRRLLKAYRVRPQRRPMDCQILGGKSRTFSDKEQAIEAAKKKAALENVGVLVFEGGHVTEVNY